MRETPEDIVFGAVDDGIDVVRFNEGVRRQTARSLYVGKKVAYVRCGVVSDPCRSRLFPVAPDKDRSDLTEDEPFSCKKSAPELRARGQNAPHVWPVVK